MKVKPAVGWPTDGKNAGMISGAAGPCKAWNACKQAS